MATEFKKVSYQDIIKLCDERIAEIEKSIDFDMVQSFNCEKNLDAYTHHDSAIDKLKKMRDWEALKDYYKRRLTNIKMKNIKKDEKFDDLFKNIFM